MKNDRKGSYKIPTIAVSAKWGAGRDRLNWIAGNGFALEYSPDPDNLRMLSHTLSPFLKKGIAVCHHAFFPGYEFAHSISNRAEKALNLHLQMIDAIQGLGEQVVTLHIGLNPEDPINEERAVINLTRLVNYAKNRGIMVCLENLRRGPTSNPEILFKWAISSGAMITLDTGHMISCELVKKSEITIPDFIQILAARLRHVHIYQKETDRHYPPKDMKILGPIIDKLLKIDCSWWTIELDDYGEVLNTRKLIIDYLNAKPLDGEKL